MHMVRKLNFMNRKMQNLRIYQTHVTIIITFVHIDKGIHMTLTLGPLYLDGKSNRKQMNDTMYIC